MPDPVTKQCSKCGQVKPLGEFQRLIRAADGLQYRCKECRSADNRRWRGANRDAIREDKHRYYLANKEEHRAKGKLYYETHRDYFRDWGRQYYAANPELMRLRARQRRQRLREAVFSHYGTVCACCGATEHLTIDHLQGDGAAARRMYGFVSDQFYAWLRRHGFPPGYQALCLSCNSSKGTGDRCRINHGRSTDDG